MRKRESRKGKQEDDGRLDGVKTPGRRTGKQSGEETLDFGKMTYGGPRWWLLFSFGRREDDMCSIFRHRPRLLSSTIPCSLVPRATRRPPTELSCFLLFAVFCPLSSLFRFLVPPFSDAPPNGVVQFQHCYKLRIIRSPN